MIGLHVSKYPSPREHRDFAQLRGWGITQSNFGSAKSFDVPTEFQERSFLLTPVHPLWVWHAAYVAAAAPKPEKWEYHANYLKAIARAADWWNVHGIVVHTGATVGLDAPTLVKTIHEFVRTTQLDQWLRKSRTKLIVEVAANISNFNCNPQLFAASVRDSDILGWCLDLAHVYGTGVKWERLQTIIRNAPPTICHVNFPGTYFASSCDVHGWRHQPRVYKDGRKMDIRSQAETDELIAGWEDTVKLLKSLNVPLVLEGSGFPGDIGEELEVIKAL